MDWSIFSGFIHGLDIRDTKRPELSDSNDTLPGRQKGTGAPGSGVLVDIKGIFNQTLGYGIGGQHNA